MKLSILNHGRDYIVKRFFLFKIGNAINSLTWISKRDAKRLNPECDVACYFYYKAISPPYKFYLSPLKIKINLFLVNYKVR